MLSKLLSQKLHINLINVDLIEESAQLYPKCDQKLRLPSINKLFNEPKDDISELVQSIQNIIQNQSQLSSFSLHQPKSRISPHQILVLNNVYGFTEFPTRSMRHYLSKVLGLSPRSVQIWFQNQRQKKKAYKNYL